MPDRRSSERHLEISDADDRVVELDDLEDFVPPTDDGDPEVLTAAPPEPLIE